MSSRFAGVLLVLALGLALPAASLNLRRTSSSWRQVGNLTQAPHSSAQRRKSAPVASRAHAAGGAHEQQQDHAAIQQTSSHKMKQTATAGGAPAPAPAPAPPPPNPPKFPVVGPTECKLLESSIVVDPPPRCEHVQYSANWDGCMCAIPQPANLNPMPNTLYNPFAQEIPPDPNIPGFPPLPTVPPPSNPLTPFVPPMMVPSCPFADPCGDKDPLVHPFQECVGFDSFGFSEVRMGKYSPASRFFNAIHCFYIMKPWDLWKVPKKIQGFFLMREKHGDVASYQKNEALNLECKSQTFTDNWHAFCEEMVMNLDTPCEKPWNQLWSGDCEGAPPPTKDFGMLSQLGEFCPFHCGFKKHELDWPYEPPPDPPAPAPAPAR